MTSTRDMVVAEALSWEGTPYHHAGRIKGVGADCAMYPAEVYAAAGMIPPVVISDYPRDWHQHRNEERYLAMVLDHARELAEGEAPLPGDFLLWKIGHCFAHGAIVLEWPAVIHAVAGQGVVRDDASQRSRLFFDARTGWRPRRAFTLWA
jgi:cell wall-associated NlpC family hydrolase